MKCFGLKWSPKTDRPTTLGIWIILTLLLYICTLGDGDRLYDQNASLLDTSDSNKGHQLLSYRNQRSASGLSDLLMNLHLEQPSFDPTVAKNVTTQLGQTVYLHCIVHNLGDKTVSWIRRRDFHVLTVGLVTYTSDDRFQAVHMERSDDWILKLQLAQLSDAGLYECQVNTHPLISLFVFLTVVVPKASIRESPDLYVKTGSSINLTCLINQSPEPPAFVFWYHNDRMINYDSTRGEINLQKAGEDTAISRLYITNAQPIDSGNYTCGPSNADATSISVHVLNGEKRAAIQHDLNTSPSICSRFTSNIWIVINTFLVLGLYQRS
ncbi:V-set and immunoglobulin domain-containing protein 10-like [Centruroides vittatus]|uniref:V-set and immunoglobulin domain-containing protein 10-like n=1 Tax=Centruroides vittatus TaxID=120091 RepID=UPI00350EF42F